MREKNKTKCIRIFESDIYISDIFNDFYDVTKIKRTY